MHKRAPIQTKKLKSYKDKGFLQDYPLSQRQNSNLNSGLLTASSPLPAALSCSFHCSQPSRTIADRKTRSGMWLSMNFSKLIMVRTSYVFGSCL